MAKLVIPQDTKPVDADGSLKPEWLTLLTEIVRRINKAGL